jgi:hypothetical protein
VGRVLAHVGAEELADGAVCGLGGIGRAHEVAPGDHGVVALEHDEGDGRPGHELHELTEEGALAVHLVEALGDGAREVGHPDGEDAEASLLDAGEDGAGGALLDGVRLHDAEGAFDGHGGVAPDTG